MRRLALCASAVALSACAATGNPVYPAAFPEHASELLDARADAEPLAVELRWIAHTHLETGLQTLEIYNYDQKTFDEVEHARKSKRLLESLPDDALLRRLDEPAVGAAEIVDVGVKALEARRSSLEGEDAVKRHTQLSKDLSKVAVDMSAGNAQMTKMTEGLNITVTAVNGLANALVALSPAIDAAVRKQYQADLSLALEDGGYVGPSGPEGTILFVYLYMESVKASDPVGHYATVFRADLRLLRPGKDNIDATDGVAARVFPKKYTVAPGSGYTYDTSWSKSEKLAGVNRPVDHVLVRAAAEQLEAAILAEGAAEQ